MNAVSHLYTHLIILVSFAFSNYQFVVLNNEVKELRKEIHQLNKEARAIQEKTSPPSSSSPKKDT